MVKHNVKEELNDSSLEDVEDLLNSAVENHSETTVKRGHEKIYVKTTNIEIENIVESIQELNQFETAHVGGRFPPMKPSDGELYTVVVR